MEIEGKKTRRGERVQIPGIQKNRRQKTHVRERKRKAATMMREIWAIGKRICGRDWEKRIWLFDMLVWTVMGYGAEIRGWKERKEIERIG